MSSEEEQELPVAAEVTAVGGMPDEGAAIQNFVQISEGDELVRREDAEAEIAEERSKKYDKGFFEGRQSREEEILDKIQQMMSDHDSDSSRVKTEFNKGYQAALRKIREKLRARKND